MVSYFDFARLCAWHLCVKSARLSTTPHAESQSRKGKPQSKTLPGAGVGQFDVGQALACRFSVTNLGLSYILAFMLANILGSIWRYLPGAIRRRLVRLGQRRFTVTVGAMLFDQSGRILLLEHVFRPDSGWGIPGGFVGRREQPEAALRRELREEVDIEIEDARLLFVRALGRPRQLEIYFCARVVGDPKPSSFEIKQAKWFAVEALPPELSKDQQRLIHRAIPFSEKSQQ